jgi:hypothetical protein
MGHLNQITVVLRSQAMIGSEQKAFLVRRFREAAKQQPDLRRLKTILLQLGGEFVVPAAKPDPDVAALLER